MSLGGSPNRLPYAQPSLKSYPFLILIKLEKGEGKGEGFSSVFGGGRPRDSIRLKERGEGGVWRETENKADS